MFFRYVSSQDAYPKKTTGSQIPPLPGMQAPHPVNTATFLTPNRVTTVPALSEGAAVRIQENDFNPYSLVVMNGTIVTWINEDEFFNYSVISDNDFPVSFHSGIHLKGGIFQFRFARPGTYPYHSTTTSEITGEIVVL
jgi:plastocyanin